MDGSYTLKSDIDPLTPFIDFSSPGSKPWLFNLIYFYVFLCRDRCFIFWDILNRFVGFISLILLGFFLYNFLLFIGHLFRYTVFLILLLLCRLRDLGILLNFISWNLLLILQFIVRVLLSLNVLTFLILRQSFLLLNLVLLIVIFRVDFLLLFGADKLGIQQYHPFIHNFEITSHLIEITVEFIDQIFNFHRLDLNNETVR